MMIPQFDHLSSIAEEPDAFQVESQNAGDNLLVRQIMGPAIGIEHRRVDLFLQMRQYPDSAVIMDFPLAIADRSPAQALFEDNVEAS